MDQNGFDSPSIMIILGITAIIPSFIEYIKQLRCLCRKLKQYRYHIDVVVVL
ncbi:hypothetical protein RchiOBHm_Chr1g0340651 [Rosa chinensis]|uniref:Uncharacterized protein n=1 Tax=Rosa chinensis TaxID=74649 RepID=A0A2P6SDH4_ROSCH|nr:hypothetical protein RchiOBHm_Chr1g0340651 [Rosa chinensis]